MDWPEFNLTAALDWLDEAAGGLIRLAYLAAGVTAVAVYFGAGQLPTGVDAALNAALPWSLAFAVETHTYLTARRVRVAWQERDRVGLQVNAGVLLVLLAFSAWNQLGYLSGVWTPPHSGPLALPTWLAYAVRALIVPSAFMAAAFLAPLAPPITAQIEGEARATLADVFRIARKQRRKMLRAAEAAGRDMTSALVELVADDETRRIISHAYNAIRAQDEPVTALQGAGVTQSAQMAPNDHARIEASQAPHTAAQDGRQTAPTLGADGLPVADAPPVTATDEPRPDGPPDGSPDGSGPSSSSLATKLGRGTSGAGNGGAGNGGAGNVTPLRRGLGRRPRQDRRTASRANALGGRRGQAETKIRAALASAPNLTHAELVARTGVSPSTASKYMRIVSAEQAAHLATLAQ